MWVSRVIETNGCSRLVGKARKRRAIYRKSDQYIPLGHFGPDCDLSRHGLDLAARGGKAAKSKAVVAIARKLAVLILVLWEIDQSYEALRMEANYPRKSAAAVTMLRSLLLDRIYWTSQFETALT